MNLNNKLLLGLAGLMLSAATTASSPTQNNIAIQPVPIEVRNGDNRITLYVVPEDSTCFTQRKDDLVYDYE